MHTGRRRTAKLRLPNTLLGLPDVITQKDRRNEMKALGRTWTDYNRSGCDIYAYVYMCITHISAYCESIKHTDIHVVHRHRSA